MALALLNPQTTLALTQARQQVAERRQNHRVRQRARLAAFQEFRTSYCDLFDAADWQHYQAATGLQLATLLRVARYQWPRLKVWYRS